MRLPIRLFLALLALQALSVCSPQALAVAEGSFQRILNVTGPVDLDVSTGAGNITVRTGDEGSVRVSGTIRASNGWFGKDDVEKRIRYLEEHPLIEQNSNFLRIGHSMDNELQRHLSISYDLIVPAATRLRSRTGSGDQSLEGVRGPVNVGTGSGTIKISKLGAEVHAETGSGDIDLNSVEGPVRASTGSGNIRAKGITSDLKATTGSGDVTVDQSTANDVTVETGSGNAVIYGVRGALHVSTGSGDVTAQGEVGSDWRASTGSGNVTVKLPAQASYTLEAKTSSGTIHTAREITVQGSLGKNELRGKVGGGGHLVHLDTGSGDIRIE
jgi:hypothetical protein